MKKKTPHENVKSKGTREGGEKEAEWGKEEEKKKKRQMGQGGKEMEAGQS